MNEFRLAVPVESIDRDDAACSGNGAGAIQNLHEILPDVAVILLSKKNRLTRPVEFEQQIGINRRHIDYANSGTEVGGRQCLVDPAAGADNDYLIVHALPHDVTLTELEGIVAAVDNSRWS